jgi:transposase-like protein
MSQRKPEALRATARRLHSDGRSIAAIAKALGVAYSAAHKWIRRAEAAKDHAIDPVWLLAVSRSWRSAA